MNTTSSTADINKLIDKYTKQIAARNEQINIKQKQLNKDREDVTYLTNKIQTLKGIILELKQANEEEEIEKFKGLNNIFEQARQSKPTDLLDKAAQAAKKWNGLDTKTPSASAVDSCEQETYNFPNWSAEKTWSECSKELNKIIEELNKNNNASQLDIYTTAIWPADLGM